MKANSDFQNLFVNFPWLVGSRYTIRPLDFPFALAQIFRATFPVMAELLEQARVSHLEINGQIHRLFAWDISSGQSIGWLTVLEQESAYSVSLIEKHRLLLDQVGGIREWFHTFEGDNPFFTSMSFWFTGSACKPALDGWSDYYQTSCDIDEAASLDTSTWVAFAIMGNGDLAAYDPSDERVYLFAHDYGFGFSGVVPVPGQPSETFYTLPGVYTFTDCVESLAKAWLGLVGKPTNTDKRLTEVRILPPIPRLSGLLAENVIQHTAASGLVDADTADRLLELDRALHFSETQIKWLIGFGQDLIPILSDFWLSNQNDQDALVYLRVNFNRCVVSPQYCALLIGSSPKLKFEKPRTGTSLSFSDNLELDNKDSFIETLSHTAFASLRCASLHIRSSGKEEQYMISGNVEFVFQQLDKPVQWSYTVGFGTPEPYSIISKWKLTSPCNEKSAFSEVKFEESKSPGNKIASFAIYVTHCADLEANPRDYSTWLPPESLLPDHPLRIYFHLLRHIVLITQSGNILILTRSHEHNAFGVHLNKPNLLEQIEQAALDPLNPTEVFLKTTSA